MPRRGRSNNHLPVHDPVNHPLHYTDGDIEACTYIEDRGWAPGFHLGNAVKYLHRAGKKQGASGVQDLRKAMWYIQRLIDWMEHGKEIWLIQPKDTRVKGRVNQ